MRLLHIPALAAILATGLVGSAMASEPSAETAAPWAGRCLGIEDAFRSATDKDTNAILYPEGRPEAAQNISNSGFALPWQCNDSDNGAVFIVHQDGGKTLFRVKDERNRDRPVMVLMQSANADKVKAAIDADKAEYARSVALERQWGMDRAELNIISGITRSMMLGLKGTVVLPPSTLGMIEDRFMPPLDGHKASGYYAILSSNGFFSTTATNAGDELSPSLFDIASPSRGYMSPELRVSAVPGYPDKTLLYVTNNTVATQRKITDDNPATLDSVYYQTCDIYLGHGKCAIWGMIVPTADVPVILPNLKLQILDLVTGGIREKAKMDKEDAENRAKIAHADAITRNAVTEAKAISQKTGY